MPPSGTFDYLAVVPEGAPDAAAWSLKLREPVNFFVRDRLARDRLVGHSPTLRITDAGLTPDEPTPLWSSFTRPKVFRSLITLTAARKRTATVPSASFHVARGFISALRPRDVVHLARTACAGLGVSVIRGNRLVAAVGAVTAVPLGDDVQVRTPHDLIDEVEAVLKSHDPELEYGDLLREMPVAVKIGQRRSLRFSGRIEMGEYEVYVAHGFRLGIPGMDMCVAISLRGACSVVDANASAQLLELDGLTMAEW